MYIKRETATQNREADQDIFIYEFVFINVCKSPYVCIEVEYWPMVRETGIKSQVKSY